MPRALAALLSGFFVVVMTGGRMGAQSPGRGMPTFDVASVKQNGSPGEIVFVRMEPGGRFVVHAWVEHDGDILLNTAEDVAPYTRFLKLDDALVDQLTRQSETPR